MQYHLLAMLALWKCYDICNANHLCGACRKTKKQIETRQVILPLLSLKILNLVFQIYIISILGKFTHTWIVLTHSLHKALYNPTTIENEKDGPNISVPPPSSVLWFPINYQEQEYIVRAKPYSPAIFAGWQLFTF